jgi:hypothetical protein
MVWLERREFIVGLGGAVVGPQVTHEIEAETDIYTNTEFNRRVD